MFTSILDAADLWLNGPPLLLVYSAAAVFVAFAIRGFSGFGSSLVAISALTLVLSPARVVPAIFALEILASVSLLPSVWRDVNWRSLIWISAGCAFATPLGMVALARGPVDAIRGLISAVVLSTAIVMLRGAALRRSPGRTATFGAGCLVGLLNGSTGIGGPPAVVFYFSDATSAVAGRATIIAFFLFTDLYAMVFAGTGGLLDAHVLVLALFALPFVLTGIWIGKCRFVATDPKVFRRYVLWLLAALGLAGILVAGFRYSGLQL